MLDVSGLVGYTLTYKGVVVTITNNGLSMTISRNKPTIIRIDEVVDTMDVTNIIEQLNLRPFTYQLRRGRFKCIRGLYPVSKYGIPEIYYGYEYTPLHKTDFITVLGCYDGIDPNSKIIYIEWGNHDVDVPDDVVVLRNLGRSVEFISGGSGVLTHAEYRQWLVQFATDNLVKIRRGNTKSARK